jgi:hypothetical protein
MNEAFNTTLKILARRGAARPEITPDKTIHIILCVVDHFEPFNGNAAFGTAKKRVEAWSKNYPVSAAKYKDSDGRHPQHTWFYPPHHDPSFLAELVPLCSAGFGEIEMHLHHNRMEPFPDTAETLKDKLKKCLETYSRYGIFCLPDGSRRFAFIHGDWSLDNSRGAKFCGVNSETAVLRECGCYADFTFPTLCSAQPDKINAIYYVKNDPARAKSYNTGSEISVGGAQEGDLMIIQGILGLRWKSRKHLFRPSIETSDLDFGDEPNSARVDYWVKHALTVRGKPEWKFIKLHSHGAREDAWDSLFGKSAESMFKYLELSYNDGRSYMLHYVTAREMYNIIKAAEAGKSDNPGLYRDFVIPGYNYLRK